MRPSFKEKLPVLIVLTYAVMAVAIFACAHLAVKNSVDRALTNDFQARLGSIVEHLRLQDADLEATGMVKAYGQQFREQAIAQFRDKYYAKRAGAVYPFIIGDNGLVVAHPRLPAGSENAFSRDVLRTLLARKNGDCYGTYDGAEQWTIFRSFAKWGWIVGYTVPVAEKYADVYRLDFQIGAIIVVMALLSIAYAAWLVNRIERRRSEESLRKSEERHRLLYESSRDGIMVLGPPGWALLRANPAALKMLQLDDESQIAGRGLGDFPPERQPDGQSSLEKAREMIEAALREGFQSFEWCFQPAPGETLIVEIQLNRLELGGETLLQAIAHDITHRKAAEDAAAMEVRRMASLLAINRMTDRPMEDIVATVVENAVTLTRSTIGYLAVLDEQEAALTMQYWSKSAYASCRMIDKPVIYPVEKTGLWEEAVRQRKPVVTNDCAASNVLKRGIPDGRVQMTRHMNVPVFDGNRIVAVAGVGNKPTDYDDRDVRQLQLLMDGWWHIVIRKRAEEALIESNRRLEEATARAGALAREATAASRAKGEFLANMSHEIRTPMNAIVGFSELLAQEEITATQREYIRTISESAGALLNIINDILDFSKIETGNLKVECIDCSVPQVLGTLTSMLGPRMAEKGLDFQIRYRNAVPSVIRTDPTRLLQCLVNLVGNALKFTECGHVHVFVGVESRQETPIIQFDVEDTGIGIPRDKIGLLFQSFSQADSSTTRKYGGTGLGLAITKQLAILMGGSVRVTSEPGVGSTFTLSIPTGVPAAAGTATETKTLNVSAPAAVSAPAVMYSGRVLVAEDVPPNRKLLDAMLKKVGLEAVLVENGQKAVEAAAKEPFDLILMDMQMPVMNGYDATRTLRRQGLTTPIVALTAHAMKGDEEKCLDAGCDGYLSKPIVKSMLLEVLGKYLTVRTAEPAASDSAG